MLSVHQGSTRPDRAALRHRIRPRVLFPGVIFAVMLVATALLGGIAAVSDEGRQMAAADGLEPCIRAQVSAMIEGTEIESDSQQLGTPAQTNRLITACGLWLDGRSGFHRDMVMNRELLWGLFVGALGITVGASIGFVGIDGVRHERGGRGDADAQAPGPTGRDDVSSTQGYVVVIIVREGSATAGAVPVISAHPDRRSDTDRRA